MGYSRVLSVFGRKSPWVPVGSVLVFASMLGCGNIYRPVVTSLPPVQPSSQPSKYAVVISCGSNLTVPPSSIDQIEQVCADSTVPGLASLVDFAGDSLMAKVNVGNGPRWLGLNSNGTLAYITNADGTVSSFTAQTSPLNPLESNKVNTSTLLPNPTPGLPPPNTLLSTANYLYVSQPGRSSIAVLKAISGAAPSAFLEVPITDTAAPTIPQNPVYLVGNSTTQRVYAISQGANAGGCPTSGSNGTATGIETSTNTPSSTLPLGICPIFGIMSPDNRRTFILNQGSGTVTVIDSQQNQIDTNPNLTNGTIAVGQGPVWADIYNGGAILAVANSISGTLSLINVSTDSFGHDTPNFGQIIATVPVGSSPSSVSILQDGTRAYVANRGDGTVSVVSLTNNTVTKTITLLQQPCQAGNPGQKCTVHPLSIAATTGTPLGKVYVISPDTNVMTIIRTDNDTIYENLALTGGGIQVRVTAP
jgi:YVTN family beta-propeller protein